MIELHDKVIHITTGRSAIVEWVWKDGDAKGVVLLRFIDSPFSVTIWTLLRHVRKEQGKES